MEQNFNIKCVILVILFIGAVFLEFESQESNSDLQDRKDDSNKILSTIEIRINNDHYDNLTTIDNTASSLTLIPPPPTQNTSMDSEPKNVTHDSNADTTSSKLNISDSFDTINENDDGMKDTNTKDSSNMQNLSSSEIVILNETLSSNHEQESNITDSVFEDKSPEKQVENEDDGELGIMGEDQEQDFGTAGNVDDAMRIDEGPHVVFDDLHYRRVCAPVGTASVLCLTIRFSFQVPLQNPALTYPSPVADQFYNLTGDDLYILDGQDLDVCRKIESLGESSLDATIKQCLDMKARTVQEKSTFSMVMVFTRARQGNSTILFGTGSESQRENIRNFFAGQAIVVLGDSTGPGVTRCIGQLFGDCIYSPIDGQASMYCGGRRQNKRRLKSGGVPFPEMDESYSIFLGFNDYYPPGKFDHDLPLNMTSHLATINDRRKPGWNKLRPMSVIISYPFAHFQNQQQMLNNYEKVKYLQTEYPKLIISANSTQGRAEMANLGFELKHIISYEGCPQYFPTITSGYVYGTSYFDEPDFLAQQGYPAEGNSPAWRMEFGTTCRGPVPPNSLMRNVSRLSRRSFEDNGLDMRFYLQNWEFTNQLWWMFNGYGPKGLDCTHGHNPDYYCMHKYLLQAMVDDYYENQEDTGLVPSDNRF